MQITLGQAATLSDVFAVEWGLRKLFLKECDLDEFVRDMLASCETPINFRIGFEANAAFPLDTGIFDIPLGGVQPAAQTPCIPSSRCLCRKGAPISYFDFSSKLL